MASRAACALSAKRSSHRNCRRRTQSARIAERRLVGGLRCLPCLERRCARVPSAGRGLASDRCASAFQGKSSSAVMCTAGTRGMPGTCKMPARQSVGETPGFRTHFCSRSSGTPRPSAAFCWPRQPRTRDSGNLVSFEGPPCAFRPAVSVPVCRRTAERLMGGGDGRACNAVCMQVEEGQRSCLDELHREACQGRGERSRGCGSSRRRGAQAGGCGQHRALRILPRSLQDKYAQSEARALRAPTQLLRHPPISESTEGADLDADAHMRVCKDSRQMASRNAPEMQAMLAERLEQHMANNLHPFMEGDGEHEYRGAHKTDGQRHDPGTNAATASAVNEKTHVKALVKRIA